MHRLLSQIMCFILGVDTLINDSFDDPMTALPGRRNAYTFSFRYIFANQVIDFSKTRWECQFDAEFDIPGRYISAFRGPTFSNSNGTHLISANEAQLYNKLVTIHSAWDNEEEADYGIFAKLHLFQLRHNTS